MKRNKIFLLGLLLGLIANLHAQDIKMMSYNMPRFVLIAILCLCLCSCADDPGTVSPPVVVPEVLSIQTIIPKPVQVTITKKKFTLTKNAVIYVSSNDETVLNVGHYLAGKLNPATGFELQVQPTIETPAPGNIYLALDDSDAELGDEGYTLSVAEDGITLKANTAEGLFRGSQTIRQLFPAAIELSSVQVGPWEIPTGTVRDYPEYEWRGTMLDVARHFFSVAEVKAFIDLAAYYKLNRFHLHLSDDQGWRIQIDSWPNLTTHGGSTQVGGGQGGYYTKAQYAEIVDYATSQFITIVPEIDMPGHVNAALASYAELNCDGVAPALYTGTNVGFSSLCIDKEVTYDFVADVIHELAEMTPGPYIHIGGDEAHATNSTEYKTFINKVQDIVQLENKQMIGWEEIAQASILPGVIAQHWNSSYAATAVGKGATVIMSPASRAYLDMKYNTTTTLGLNWAGYISVMDGYMWDPATQVSGVAKNNVLGIEAPLWTETIVTMNDIEFMAFPRLPGYAEIGWSSSVGKSWSEYSVRLAHHGPRFSAMNINFYESFEVNWKH
jgi:hexosaminidase